MKTALIALLSTVLGVAHAQSASNDTYDFELFRPAADHYGYFAVPSAATLGHLQLGGGFFVNYQNDPIILVTEDIRVAPRNAEVTGDNGEGIVDDRLTGNVQLGFGLSRLSFEVFGQRFKVGASWIEVLLRWIQSLLKPPGLDVGLRLKAK